MAYFKGSVLPVKECIFCLLEKMHCACQITSVVKEAVLCVSYGTEEKMQPV